MCLLNLQRQITLCPNLHTGSRYLTKLKNKLVLTLGSFKPEEEVLLCTNTASQVLQHQSTGRASLSKTELTGKAIKISSTSQ